MGKRALDAVLVLLCAGLAPAGAQSIAYGARSAAGVTAHVITVNMADPNVKVSTVVAEGFPGTDEAFTSMVKHSGAVAAINGTFFGMGTWIPIGDIVADGLLLHKGRMGTAMAITPRNKVLFGRVTWGRSADWTGYETVLACGPTLVKQGRVDLRVSEEGFRDPHVLGAANRSAVGLTESNRLLLVCVPRGVTLAKLAEMMKALGCVEAMNLDGGASMAMYYRGKVVVPAGRKLTNLLVVYEKAKHVALGEPVCLPEGNGAQPLSATAPKPQVPPGWSTGDDGRLKPPPLPEWFAAYPGAEADQEPNGLYARYRTADSVEKLAAFYRERLGKDADVQTTRVGRNYDGIIQLLSGPGAGTRIFLDRRADAPHTTITVSFHRPGRPMPKPVRLPKPVATEIYDDVRECSIGLAKPPAGFPTYPGTKRFTMLGESGDPPMYAAPAGFQQMLNFYRKFLGDRARVNVEPLAKMAASVRVLTGPCAGTMVKVTFASPKQSILQYYREEKPGGE